MGNCKGKVKTPSRAVEKEEHAAEQSSQNLPGVGEPVNEIEAMQDAYLSEDCKTTHLQTSRNTTPTCIDTLACEGHDRNYTRVRKKKRKKKWGIVSLGRNSNTFERITQGSSEGNSNPSSRTDETQANTNVQANKELNRMKFENKQLENEVSELTREVTGLTGQLRESHQEIENLDTTVTISQSMYTRQIEERDLENKRLKAQVAELEERDIKMQQNLLENQDCISELRNRLSLHMACKMTDNNPDIANLGDRNIPEKLGERFKELYDNQWTDAIEYLTEKEHMIEADAITYLVDVVKVIFKICDVKATQQLRSIERAIQDMLGTPEVPGHLSPHVKMFKEERKTSAMNSIPAVTKVVNAELKNHNKSKNHESLNVFVVIATEICWLMCIQDPPMTLDTDCQPGSKVDKRSFNFYTSVGTRVSHLVWPTVYMCKGGRVLQKGVVQGRKKTKQTSVDGARNLCHDSFPDEAESEYDTYDSDIVQTDNGAGRENVFNCLNVKQSKHPLTLPGASGRTSPSSSKSVYGGTLSTSRMSYEPHRPRLTSAINHPAKPKSAYGTHSGYFDRLF